MATKAESEKQFQEWVDSVHWKFAKTYAKHAPHEYSVTEWKPELGKTFTALARFICEHGQIDLYHGHPFTVYYLNGWKYWICDENPDEATLINRTCEEWSVKFGLTWNPPKGFKPVKNAGRDREAWPTMSSVIRPKGTRSRFSRRKKTPSIRRCRSTRCGLSSRRTSGRMPRQCHSARTTTSSLSAPRRRWIVCGSWRRSGAPVMRTSSSAQR